MDIFESSKVGKEDILTEFKRIFANKSGWGEQWRIINRLFL